MKMLHKVQKYMKIYIMKQDMEKRDKIYNLMHSRKILEQKLFEDQQSYMEKHPELIQAFTNALQKGMDFVNSHTPEEIAKVIAPQFAETDLDTLTTIVKRYYDQKTWKEDLIFQEDSFLLLKDILDEAGELAQWVPYEQLVTTEYAEKAVK